MKTPFRARLLDVLQDGIILPPLPEGGSTLHPADVVEFNAHQKSFLDGAVCIEASNVARFFEGTYIREDSDLTSWRADLKVMVPPFDKFFIEWEKPFVSAALRMGALFMPCKPELATSVARAFIGPNATYTPVKIAEMRANIRCKWIYLTADYLEFPRMPDHISSLRGPYHIGVVSVADDGEVLDMWFSHATGAIPIEESKELMAASLPAYTTLSMLNCANIDRIKHVAPEPLQKQRKKSGKHPYVVYHTITVNASKTPGSISRVPVPEVDGGGRRVHQRRGHIKDYRGGKGLFGRYKGVWYWGPALPGDPEVGHVLSDYKVK